MKGASLAEGQPSLSSSRKMFFSQRAKNPIRKIEEIYLALQIEKHFSKQKILSLYLNVVEFGPDIYGIRTACKYYFNKNPSDVTPEQAAFLYFFFLTPKNTVKATRDTN